MRPLHKSLEFFIIFTVSCEEADQAGLADEAIRGGDISGSLNQIMQGPTANYCPDCTEERDQPQARGNYVSNDTLRRNFERLGGDPIAFQQAMCFLNTHGRTQFRTDAWDSSNGRVRIENQRYVTINDLTKPSTHRRLFILDRQTGEVRAYHSGHGNGRGRNTHQVINYFSNDSGSNTNPSGFFITGNSYQSTASWGTGIRLHGLQRGINDNSIRRGIVIHQASYTPAGVASSREANPRLTGGQSGRSQGCTTVAPQHFREVQSILSAGTEGRNSRGGSLYFNYSPRERSQGARYCGSSLNT